MEWEAFLPHVLPDAKGCPDQEALDAVVKAARDFCQRTHVWNYECDPILTAANLARYVLQLGEHEELVKVANVDLGGCSHTVVTPAMGRRYARRGYGDRLAYFEFARQELLLTPAPHADNLELVVDVVVRPALTATEWPDDLAEHVTDIAAGAIGMLKGAKEEDWSDPAGEVSWTGRFNDRISTVGLQVSRGIGRFVPRARVRTF